jgi:hypothetical protein
LFAVVRHKGLLKLFAGALVILYCLFGRYGGENNAYAAVTSGTLNFTSSELSTVRVINGLEFGSDDINYLNGWHNEYGEIRPSCGDIDHPGIIKVVNPGDAFNIKTVKVRVDGDLKATFTGYYRGVQKGNSVIFNLAYQPGYQTITINLYGIDELRVYDDKAGNLIFLDDMVITADAAPTASPVNAAGILEVGQTLEGNYSYSDTEGAEQRTSTFKWYRYDAVTGPAGREEINGAASQTYKLQPADYNKYIAFEVAPAANAGSSPGAAVESSRLGPVQDFIMPMVTSVSVPLDGAYKQNQNLDFTVNFDENVMVVNTGSTLSLDIGGSSKTASFLSSAANSITYRYTIQPGDLDKDGITMGTSALNGITVKDMAGNDADLTLNSIGGTANIKVDGIVPAVTSVTVPSDGTYRLGQNLDFTLNFDDNITVTGTDSTLSINVGGSMKTANFLSSGESSITYRYTTKAGELDTDGIEIGTVTLNGTTVKDAAGNDADMALKGVCSTANVKVDTITPISETFDSTPVGYAEGSRIINQWTFKVIDSSGNLVPYSSVDVMGGSDHSLEFYDFAYPAKAYVAKTTDGSEFKLNSFYIESFNFDEVAIKVVGYLNGNAVPGASQTIARQGYYIDTTVTLSSTAWQCIDEFRIVREDNGAELGGIYIDDIIVSDKVIPPTVTAGNISISGASGTDGIYKIGDTVTVTWNNTASGDNNSDVISSVTVDFSQFGGGTAVPASESSGTWTAAYTITQGSIDATNINVSVTAANSDGSATTTDDANARVDNRAPAGYSAAIDQTVIKNSNKTSLSFTFSGAETGIMYNYTISSSGGGTNVTGSAPVSSASQQVDGIDVSGLGDGTLTLSATLTDGTGNTGNTATDTKLKDTVVPTVTSVSVPSDTTYIVGQNLDFTVNFSENITVTEEVYSKLSLNIGGYSKTASYQSNAANIIIYRYTIHTGDLDMDGITVETTALNGIAIKDAAGNDAELALNNIGSTLGVLVDGRTPTITTGSSATSVTSVSAVVSGNVISAGGSAVTERGIQYRSVSESVYSAAYDGSAGVGSYSISLTELIPGNSYVARAFATNSAGTSYGDMISFSTSGNNPPQVTNSSKATDENTVITFTDQDFTALYSDVEGVALNRIKIMSVTDSVYGVLMYDSINVTVGQEVYRADIGSLTFVPALNVSGSTGFTWKASDGNDYSANTAIMTINIGSNAMDIDNAKEAVTIGYAEGDSINRVTQNITVPMTGSNGTTISWESNDTEVINISGSSGMVTRPSYTAGDAHVTVTASVYKGGMTSSKEFVLTVVKLPMSDAEAVALDRDALAIGYAEGDSAASVTQNLTLPAGGSNGSTISWASDKGDVISSTGSVTRPANADGDSKVVLTVTINKSSDSTTKEFTLTVKKRDAASSGGRTSSSSTSQSASGTVSISVNGQAQQASGTLTATSEGGKTVATVTVDARKIEEKLNTEGKNSVVTIPVTTGADVVVGEFNGQTVKSMEEKETVIEIKTSTAAYTLPASQINITGISAQIGQQVDLKDIKVSIEIAKASQETAKVVENSAKAGEFTIVAPPVEFTVTCTSGDKTVNVSSFSAYVERTIEYPRE